jgi:Short C-terminal domain/Bacterial PH domain
MTAAASNGRLVKARYRVTEDAIQFEAGLVSTRAEVVPLWIVVDVDITQSVTQKARGVGDVRVRLEKGAERFGQERVVLESIKEPRNVRDLIAARANDLRTKFASHAHNLDIEKRSAGAGSINVGAPVITTNVAAAPQAPVGTSPVPELAPPVATPTTSANQALLDQLRQLGELRDAGILSDEEFQTQKQRFLDGGPAGG